MLVILEHCKSISEEVRKSIKGNPLDNKVMAYVDKTSEDSLGLFVNEDDASLLKEQTFNELLIVAGISTFEKCCKDFFAWGLKYSPLRLNIFGDKSVLVSDIIRSKDPKQTIIEKIVDDINFQDAEICNNSFKKVFGVKVFKNREERYKFEKYLNHRHIISHNCGYIDIAYLKKMGVTKEYDDLTAPRLNYMILRNF